MPHTTKTGHAFSRDLAIGIASEIVVGVGGFWLALTLQNEAAKQIVTILTSIILIGVAILLLYLRIFRRYVSLATTFEARCEDLHRLAHDTRDLIIHAGGIVPAYDSPPKPQGDRYPPPHPGLVKHKAQLERMLEDIKSLFEHLAPPGAKIWAALRDRRSDGAYYTFLRVGRFERPRERSSKALHKDTSVIVKKLRDSFLQRKCVVITGSTKGPDWWDRQENDNFGEDKSVMMGVVMTRSWDGSTSFINNRHAWILTLSSDKEDVFHDVHVPLMQACNDLFSAAANAILRDKA